MGEIKSFRDLDIWKKSIELVKEVYAITETFPKPELYGLVSQMRRSAVSAPSNVAEGFRRRHAKEFKQFLSIAMGSLAELETQLVISEELGFVKRDRVDPVFKLIDYICRMIASLIKKLK